MVPTEATASEELDNGRYITTFIMLDYFDYQKIQKLLTSLS
jgi:hypothetical protein